MFMLIKDFSKKYSFFGGIQRGCGHTFIFLIIRERTYNTYTLHTLYVLMGTRKKYGLNNTHRVLPRSGQYQLGTKMQVDIRLGKGYNPFNKIIGLKKST